VFAERAAQPPLQVSAMVLREPALVRRQLLRQLPGHLVRQPERV
jgi:hypothetical protein